jgi:hypothetical protein
LTTSLWSGSSEYTTDGANVGGSPPGVTIEYLSDRIRAKTTYQGETQAANLVDETPEPAGGYDDAWAGGEIYSSLGSGEQYVIVDLSASRYVHELTITDINTCCGGDINGALVYYSEASNCMDENGIVGFVHIGTVNTAVNNGATYKRYDIAINHNARCIKIVEPAGYMNLQEIGITGEVLPRFVSTCPNQDAETDSELWDPLFATDPNLNGGAGGSITWDTSWNACPNAEGGDIHSYIAHADDATYGMCELWTNPNSNACTKFAERSANCLLTTPTGSMAGSTVQETFGHVGTRYCRSSCATANQDNAYCPCGAGDSCSVGVDDAYDIFYNTGASGTTVRAACGLGTAYATQALWKAGLPNCCQHLTYLEWSTLKTLSHSSFEVTSANQADCAVINSESICTNGWTANGAFPNTMGEYANIVCKSGCSSTQTPANCP